MSAHCVQIWFLSILCNATCWYLEQVGILKHVTAKFLLARKARRNFRKSVSVDHSTTSGVSSSKKHILVNRQHHPIYDCWWNSLGISEGFNRSTANENFEGIEAGAPDG